MQETIKIAEAARLFREMTRNVVGLKNLTWLITYHYKHLGRFRDSAEAPLIGIDRKRFVYFVRTRQALNQTDSPAGIFDYGAFDLPANIRYMELKLARQQK
jgi:hypothetical protein